MDMTFLEMYNLLNFWSTVLYCITQYRSVEFCFLFLKGRFFSSSPSQKFIKNVIWVPFSRDHFTFIPKLCITDWSSLSPLLQNAWVMFIQNVKWSIIHASQKNLKARESHLVTYVKNIWHTDANLCLHF